MPRLRLRTGPGPAEFDALLEHLPLPALLAESKSGRILAANTLALTLSAYTKAELADLPVNTVLEMLHNRASGTAEGNHTTQIAARLIKHNQTGLDIVLDVHHLPPQGRWQLLMFEPLGAHQQRQQEKHQRSTILESMQVIVQAMHTSDLQAAMDLVMQATQGMSGAHAVAIYLQNVKASHNDVEVTRYATSGDHERLPSQLSALEMAELRNPFYWSPGKRPISSLHRLARVSGWQVVASTPLGHPKALIGLLVVAADHSLPEGVLLTQLKLLADAISALIALHSRVDNFSNQLQTATITAFLHSLVEDAISDGVILLGQDFAVQRLNRAAEIILGYSSTEAIRHPWEHILIGTSTLKPAFTAARDGLSTLNQENVRLYRRSGQAFLAKISILPAFLDQKLKGVLVLIQDMSEQEKMQAQSRQLEQQAFLGEFTAIFAHEVRNPINNISTGLQLMAYNLPDDDPNQEIIARLQQDCDRLTDLMKSVLAFSKQTDYEMAPLDMGILVTRLVERLRPRMVENNVQHQLYIDPNLPLIPGNSRALEQVFNNLIMNAIQAMNEKGGNLTVKIQRSEAVAERPHVEVAITDEGPGIPKELQERIFQPFYTTKSTGTGLGLAITKRIVTAHKGSLSLSSIPGGTVFYVRLPVVEPE